MTTEQVIYEPFRADTWKYPFTLYRKLRDSDPVHYSPKSRIWVLTRFRDVYAAALDSARFSSEHGISLTNETEALSLLPTMVMMDPPRHTVNRRRVNRRFSPRNVQDVEPVLRNYVSALIDQLCEKGTGDFVDAVARPVPCFVVAHYLGVPEGDRVLFERWTSAIVQASSTGSTNGAEGALLELYGYFKDLVAERRTSPGDDMLSALAQPDADGEELSTEEILGYAFVMIAGGNDTATGLIAGAAELLSAHPDQRQILLSQPETMRGAVEEFLRMTTPVQGLCRVTQSAVDIDGTVIPADSRVLLCYGAANRDPREFGPDAEELNINRRVGRQLAFSSGVHHCIGSHAARLQGRVVLEELLKICPDFCVDSDSATYAGGPFVRRHESLPFIARATSR